MIALAWHVDYWDRLGWRDPFASRLATDRQRAYARALGDEVFTPALVVDGARVVVGSRQGDAETAIATASALPVSVHLEPGAAEISAAPESAGTVIVGERTEARGRH